MVSADAAQIAALRADPAVRLIAGDLLVSPLVGADDKAIGADQVRTGSGGLLGLGFPGVNGRGIGVAVVDSGIAPHAALAGKVVAAVNFVAGDPRTVTPSATARTSRASSPAGRGGATSPVQGRHRAGRALVNVRVLGNNGGGYTSDVIAGIQWVVAETPAYGIRVVNLSLGHPAVEPCATDPMCLAVKRRWSRGLVVVASAGNRGKDADGQRARQHHHAGQRAGRDHGGRAEHVEHGVARDDTVTTYSSRGPTRYDMLFKPDVVAPGNKIVSLEAKRLVPRANYPRSTSPVAATTPTRR